jgi:hypothetical protein
MKRGTKGVVTPPLGSSGVTGVESYKKRKRYACMASGCGLRASFGLQHRRALYCSVHRNLTPGLSALKLLVYEALSY